MRGTGTKHLSRRGKDYITRFERAARAIELAGSRPPEDRPHIDRAYVRARKTLENYIQALESHREQSSGEAPEGLQ